MPERKTNDPQYWRDRANETRVLADLIKDPESRFEMLKIAQGYDRLAICAEARSKDKISN